LISNDASDFNTLLDDNIMETLLRGYFTLFVPTNEIFEHLMKELNVSYEHLITNGDIASTVPNHICHDVVDRQKNQSIVMLSGMTVEIKNNRIDDIEILHSMNIGHLRIYYIRGLLANEDQNKKIMSDPETLSEEEIKSIPDKHERCIYHLKNKNSQWCQDNGYKAYAVGSDGRVCYNPWAVCSRVRE